MKLEYWVINMLIFSLPLTWYIIFHMYKDLKKKDKIIEIQKKLIDDYFKRNEKI